MAKAKTANQDKSNRRDDVLEAAARLFAAKGYAATSIRDIAYQVGILSGSLYYHFASKEELLLEVHARGVTQVTEAVQNALANSTEEPWSRMSAACHAHLEVLLGDSPFSQVITPQFPGHFDGDVRATLLAQRDGYEEMFRALVKALPLPKKLDQRHFRLALLGALNWTPTWYQTGGTDTPSKIASGIVDAFRFQLDPKA
ncbi:TetR/AcrR family transcriptional regulator [Kineobactrum sediminis]|uniref:TetR/AcrR family transcriptional regulator n=1 Tax=Kineobactrum sediminis TaxID=1905677 RepID=A0A2N5Y4J8_9GAMM|nr:TetR/AcrR family transcriptional regulator [Kineobactrum sediminis]PLW83302.1 TetR/AcrR family transcriptional regulator [Kineobactrum sediminis]